MEEELCRGKNTTPLLVSEAVSRPQFKNTWLDLSSCSSKSILNRNVVFCCKIASFKMFHLPDYEAEHNLVTKNPSRATGTEGSEETRIRTRPRRRSDPSLNRRSPPQNWTSSRSGGKRPQPDQTWTGPRPVLEHSMVKTRSKTKGSGPDTEQTRLDSDQGGTRARPGPK